MNKEDLLSELLARASTHYTAGSQRQVIQLAYWLLSDYRTEDELCEQIHYVLDEVYPLRREAMLKKALAKLRTPDAKKFIAGCKKSERQRAGR